MAEEWKTRFVTEVAPSKLISRTKRTLMKKLDTIDEEERDFDANGSLSTPLGSSSDREPSYGSYREVSLALVSVSVTVKVE